MRKSVAILAGVSALALSGISSGAHAATFFWSGGNYVPGGTSPDPLLSPDILSLVTGANKFFNGVAFTNQSGTVDWQGGTIFLSNGAVVTNQSLWDTTSDNSLIYNGGAATTFNNSGIFRKSGGVGATSIGSIGFVNSGTIDAQTGRIVFGGGAVFNAGSDFTGAGEVAITNGATFNGASTSANLEFEGGTYTGNAATLSGTADWNADTFSGAWTVTNGSTLRAVGGSNKLLNAAAFTNDGTIDWEGGALFLSNGSQLINNGTLDYSASVSLNNNGGAVSTITNSATGLFQVGAGSTVTIANTFVNNGGTLTADGVLNFDNGTATFNDNTIFNGAGTNAINNNAAFNGDISSVNLRFNGGTFTGTAAALDGTADWAGGNFSGGWNLTAGSTLSIVTGANKLFGGASFTNDGTIDWQAGALFLSNGSQLLNNGVIAYAGSSSLNNNGGAVSTVTNSATGLFQVDAGVTVNVANTFVNNGGTLTANGILNFNNGTATFNDNTIFNGGGTNAINNDAAFNGDISSVNLRFNGGTFTGTAAALDGTADWAAGNFAGGWNLTSGSTLTTLTGANKLFGGASFTNDGTIDWQGGALFLSNGSQLINNGTIDYAVSSSLNNNGGAVSTITNSTTGLIQVDAGQAVAVNNRFVNNGGTLNADGDLNFNNGTAIFNAGTVFSGAGVNAINASAAFNDGSTSSNLRFNGGTFTGTAASLSGTAAYAAGTFSGDWTLANGATLTTVTGSNKLFNAANFTNDGTIAWQGGALFVSNASLLTNNGTIDFQIDTSFNNNGGAASSFVNNGLIEKTGGAGTTTLASGIGFDNNGTINVLSGTIALPGGFTNDGILGGTGTFSSTNLVNAGSIAPGAPGATGTLALTGSFVQAASGLLRTQLASSAAADLFNIGGSASLGGTLALSCILGCAINNGDSFVILDSVGALSGVFANITTSGFLNGFTYDVIYDYDADLVRLTVLDIGNAPAVPEPATWAMMIAGFALAGMGVRRRRSSIVPA